MANSLSWVSDVLDVKRRKLEEMRLPMQRMLANMSVSACALAHFKPPPSPATNWTDAAATSQPEKRAKTRGGRKRLATEKQRFYLIGCSVDQAFHRFESAFRLLKKLKISDGNWDLNAYRNELAKRHFASKEIDALLQARTPMSAAKRFVARSLSNPMHPNGLRLQMVHSCYSRYLKSKCPLR